MSAYRSAGGKVDALGIPTTGNPALCGGRVCTSPTTNQVTGPSRKGTAASANRAGGGVACNSVESRYAGGRCIPGMPTGPDRPGGAVSLIAGIGGDLVGFGQTAWCLADPEDCAVNTASGGPTPDSLYQSWLNGLGVDTNSDSTYVSGQAAGIIFSLAGGALGAAGDGTALAEVAAEDLTAATDEAGADSEQLVEQGCGESFTAETKVLLASGAAIPISALSPGDKVLATNTKTGKTSPEAVTAVMVKRDTDKYDLTIRSGHRTAVIDTTRSHLFLDLTRGGWVKAGALKRGDRLRTPSGSIAAVVSGRTPADSAGWMWDISVPGGNDHDFYIDTAAAPVLVHNCPSYYRGARAGEEPSFTLKPNEYRLTGTGQLRGLSLFNSPDAITSRGMVPYEIDQSTVPEGLTIEQRGANLDHFEIIPANGEYVPPEEFQALLDQIGVMGQ